MRRALPAWSIQPSRITKNVGSTRSRDGECRRREFAIARRPSATVMRHFGPSWRRWRGWTQGSWSARGVRQAKVDFRYCWNLPLGEPIASLVLLGRGPARWLSNLGQRWRRQWRSSAWFGGPGRRSCYSPRRPSASFAWAPWRGRPGPCTTGTRELPAALVTPVAPALGRIVDVAPATRFTRGVAICGGAATGATGLVTTCKRELLAVPVTPVTPWRIGDV